MRQLVIDTATEALSLALFEGGSCIGHFHEILGRGHAERLLPQIAALPGGGRAEAITVDIGPGSFTGVRVGIAAARALGYAWNAPLNGYSTLGIVALAAQRMANAAGRDDPLAIAMTGGHGELFWQLFDTATLAPLSSPASTPIATLADMIHEETIYGSGADALVLARGYGTPVPLHPVATDFAELPPALIHNSTSPLYGRAADAAPAKPAGAL